MLYADFAAYKKESTPEEFYGSISENNFFGVLFTPAGFSTEQGEETLRKLASDIAEQKIEHLTDLDVYISDFCKGANLPAQFSLSCGYLTNNVLLLKTAGTGAVYIRRGSRISELVRGDSSASGYVESKDGFVFSVDTSQEGVEDLYRKVLENKTSSETVQKLNDLLKERDLGVGVALFVKFENKEPALSQEEQHFVEDKTASAVASQIVEEEPSFFSKFIADTKEQFYKQDQKKKITTVLMGIVLVVFIWSVILGYQRRANASIDKKTQETRELVAEKLRQADDVAFLNLARAAALINDAKQDVQSLKKELNGKKKKEIEELEKLIAKEEEKILKKEERKFEEFFDLSVEDKKALGSKMYLEGDTLVVLDSASGAVYSLSLSKKSLDRKPDASLKNGSLITSTGETILVFKPQRGVVAVDSDGKTSEALDADSEWGSIESMTAYNNNLYLLDGQKGDVYKYTPVENGFSGKSSYFKGQDKPDITGANSLAIDLSVYVGFPQAIVKFTSGVKEGFNPTFPEDGVDIEKIITDTELTKVYAWDKKKSALYVVNKDGVYERQINSQIFGRGSDVVVFGNAAYILKGSKIYSVSVD